MYSVHVCSYIHAYIYIYTCFIMYVYNYIFLSMGLVNNVGKILF